MALLIEFLLRLCLGMAAGMAIVSHRDVSSGYFRNHLYVVLGLATLAALLATTALPAALWWSVAVAVISYVGAICWLYEKPLAGKVSLWLAAIFSCVGLLILVRERFLVTETEPMHDVLGIGLHAAHKVTSSLLLGTITAAMLLGHWYLNAPGMKLDPLKRLLIAVLVVLSAHALFSSFGLMRAAVVHQEILETSSLLFVALRWLCLLGIVGLVYMTWQTLKIPNTQSATGILYVAVIAVFTGEIASLVLSAESTYPI